MRTVIEIMQPFRLRNRFDADGVLCTMVFREGGRVIDNGHCAIAYAPGPEHTIEVIINYADMLEAHGDIRHSLDDMIHRHLALTYDEDYLLRSAYV